MLVKNNIESFSFIDWSFGSKIFESMKFLILGVNLFENILMTFCILIALANA